MKTALIPLLATVLALSAAPRVLADPPDADRSALSNEMPKAPYLLNGAPTFDMTVVKFRETYNAQNPSLPITEFRSIPDTEPNAMLTRAASKINENLYASTALEKGSGKIKTLQITYLPIQGNEEKAARATAINYMAALMREFEPTLNVEQSTARVAELLEAGKGQQFYQHQVGAIRYVVSDNGEKGLTFAVEPVKLALAEG
ncbi:DUF1454 family protein [Nissabacter sp. SGAir0207]|uniref:DUF1454 family protein n=1 Tax=Nissabacter sp. SGAir0207 TaxID=2126321 RepID=UPI0010CD3DD7|nr:DUF1454 family protein [Nissabacter sp. SGAir0207]QCR37625.1 DUF1454 domain-containing protein [Nissabacter sp. SGAir0207]